MPLIPRQQIFTTEEKFVKVLDIISKIKPSHDGDFLRSFIVDLCTRYIEKDKEVAKYCSPAVGQMNKFETEFIERILNEIGSPNNFPV